ncbi:MAG: RNB domain-containing ribonuclease [Holosporaceae bacterium]|nr:MAG: RNB domain-containing ribonuclease [Holosporaceae bacterium]
MVWIQKDFDDAVWAAPDPDNEGGWHIIVAIADVAHYVTPENDIDKEALNRGRRLTFLTWLFPCYLKHYPITYVRCALMKIVLVWGCIYTLISLDGSTNTVFSEV